jgi:hypothetical protein
MDALELGYESNEELKQDIIRFNNDIDVQTLQDYYNKKSFMEILRINRRELSHSGFIGWILDPSGEHGLFDFGIRRILELCVKKTNYNTPKIDKDIINTIISNNYNTFINEIQLEKSIIGGRIDIFIDVNISFGKKNKNIQLIIENKVEAKESKDQTKKYYEYFCKKSINNFYIFLTPFEEEPKCEYFIRIDYQDLLDNIFEAALHQNINEYYKYLIKDYIQSLSQPSFEGDDEINKGGIIMAIGKEEMKLLNDFWDKNSKLIHAAVKARREYAPEDDDILLSNQENKRRPHLHYTEIGIPIGKKISFTEEEGIEVEIKSDTKVIYNNEELSLSDLTKRLLGLQRYVRPAEYWEYKGVKLSELYDKKYPIKTV